MHVHSMKCDYGLFWLALWSAGLIIPGPPCDVKRVMELTAILDPAEGGIAAEPGTDPKILSILSK